jgi:chromosome segregation ATPase
MIKTSQISKLQNYLRQEISNIQLIVDENSQLKKEIENYQRQIGQREEENGALQAEVKHLTQMNKESNSIIKRLDDRTCELEEELNAKSYRPATLEWSGQTDPIKQEKQEDSSIATAPLLKKIGELEEIVMKLRFEKNEILSKIRSMEGSEANFSSIMESEPDETSMEGRLTLDAVLELIIQGNIREIKFRG